MLKIKIRYSPDYDSTDILFIEKKEDGSRYVAKPINLEFEKHEIGDFINPTLRINSEVAPAFLKALAEALDEQGIKTENDSQDFYFPGNVI